jgi:hypothetical protein
VRGDADDCNASGAKFVSVAADDGGDIAGIADSVEGDFRTIGGAELR